MLIAIAAFCSALLFPPKAPGQLDAYVSLRDDAFSARVSSTAAETTLEMVSQRWHGIDWKHNVELVQPKTPSACDTAILIVTGAQRPKDTVFAHEVADQAGMTVITLYQIPNQPIWGKSEDDLIAETFEQYLATGDSTWPLLFPMTKAVVRAMDSVQQAFPGRFKHFVVTGASKRGWTTWLTGATGDPRVAGIAPMVIDNLNLAAQMKRQMEYWGEYSPMIGDYSRRGLQGLMEQPRTQQLLQMVDPYAYLSKVKVPTLLVNGGNDPFWAVDALSLYWGEMRQPKWVVVVPNNGHGIEDHEFWEPAFAAFARSCAGLMKMPGARCSVDVCDGAVRATAKVKGLKETALWVADSPDMHFQDKRWRRVGPVASVDPKVNQAWFVEAKVEAGGRTFRLTSPVRVVRKRI